MESTRNKKIVDETFVSYINLESEECLGLDCLKEKIDKAEKRGANNFYLYRYGNNKVEINFINQEYESDEEYNARIEKEKKDALEGEFKAQEERRRQYEILKKEFEND